MGRVLESLNSTMAATTEVWGSFDLSKRKLIFVGFLVLWSSGAHPLPANRQAKTRKRIRCGNSTRRQREDATTVPHRGFDLDVDYRGLIDVEIFRPPVVLSVVA